jgi:hypothetical protein
MKNAACKFKKNRAQHLLRALLAAAYSNIPAAAKAKPAGVVDTAPTSTNMKAPAPRARERVQASTAG